jgi:hypothetical protein
VTGAEVGLATAGRLPDGMADTPAVVEALAVRGMCAEVAVWDDPEVEWERYPVVVTHSTWDWVGRCDEFSGWLRARQARSQLANPARLLDWSADKAYLGELASRGVAVPAGMRVGRGGEVDAGALRARLGSGPLVVKPSVGGGGHRVWRCADADEAVGVARTSLAGEPVLVQAFEPSVVTDGEYSAVFIDGRLSHVVRKRPRDGDFRVHRRYGASRELVGHQLWIDSYGRRLLSLLSDVPLYARIDFLLPQPGCPVLMELEMLEPDLYLRDDAGAAGRLAEALARRVRAAGPSAIRI